MNTRSRLVVLIAAGALAGSALAGCAQDEPSADPTHASAPRHHRQPSRDADPADPPSTGATAAGDTGGTADTVTVPVYFVGDTPQGPRLYREFRRVDAADPLGAALTLAASGDALDPDYRTALPAGTFDGGSAQDASIPLPDDSWTRRPGSMRESAALLAVQQLVYTAQGVRQDRTPITFTDSSGSATQIFDIASEDGFRAGDPLRTLALMSVTSPEQGQKVSGTLTASGVGSSFEANVPWQVRDAGGNVVAKGAATAEGWMNKLYPWQARVDLSRLEPGEYTFVASTDDPSDGEGRGPTVDTKAFTVA